MKYHVFSVIAIRIAPRRIFMRFASRLAVHFVVDANAACTSGHC